MNDNSLKISAIILAKDEEDRIDECIQSVSFCNEIIVIDNKSTDATKTVATKANARVITFASSSFADLRNHGYQESKAEWLLYIDADELVSAALRSSILEVVKDAKCQYSAYRIQRVNTYLGVEFHDSEHIVRLMKRSDLIHWEGEVHETPLIRGTVGDLVGVLRHDTHRTLTHMVEKTNKWSEIEAGLRLKATHPPVVWWRIFRVMITGFYDSYIKKGGWRVGKAGIIESMYQAFSMFVTYAKLYERQQKNPTSPAVGGIRGAGPTSPAVGGIRGAGPSI